MSTPRMNHAAESWWRQAVVYQIYPRSFADSNGDGIGDLRGIASRIDYLRALGVDAVWLSPFYPSALADGGYDVDDYRDVDPKLGTLADFDALVAGLHAAGIKLYIDIVPNHSSNRHEWFQQALAAGPGSPERDRYIFRRGVGDQPPNDWIAMFGGSVWEPVGDGWFYLHLFAPEQPDWNWDHPDVRADFLATLKFWSDRGVDGFRIDVAFALAKDLSEPFLTQAEVTATPIGPSHPYFDRDGVDEIYRGWREVFDSYDPPRVAVAELWAEHSPRKARYASVLGQAFYFDILHSPFRAAHVHKVVDEVLGWAGESGSSPTWVLSNHDVVRHASRYGLADPDSDDVLAVEDRDRVWKLSGGTDPVEDVERGLRRARAMTMFLLALPGCTYLYQGEELGLREVVDLPDDVRQDPTFNLFAGYDVGRDGCRVPLPWTRSGPSLGFGTGGAHLPQPGWFASLAVEAQDGDPGSTLTLYRAALRLRRELQGPEELTWVDAPAGVLHFVRPGGWRCVMNFTDAPVPLPDGEVLLASGPLPKGELPGETTVWLREAPKAASSAD